MNLKCLIFGHQYFVVQNFGYATRKVGCCRCHKRWGMNDRVKAFVPWDGVFDEMYTDHGYELKEVL